MSRADRVLELLPVVAFAAGSLILASSAAETVGTGSVERALASVSRSVELPEPRAPGADLSSEAAWLAGVAGTVVRSAGSLACGTGWIDCEQVGAGELPPEDASGWAQAMPLRHTHRVHTRHRWHSRGRSNPWPCASSPKAWGVVALAPTGAGME